MQQKQQPKPPGANHTQLCQSCKGLGCHARVVGPGYVEQRRCTRCEGKGGR